jgi:hypothetical protein
MSRTTGNGANVASRGATARVERFGFVVEMDHWSERAEAIAAFRLAAKLGAQEAMGGAMRPLVGYPSREAPIFAGPVTVAIAIRWGPGRRTIDVDNAIASCKGLLDGMQDAGVIGNDRQVVGCWVTQGRDRVHGGHTRVTVLAADAAREAMS